MYVLGDLFDWWIGDDQVREPFVAEVVRSLRGISDAGVPLFFGHGNRDFLLAGRFAKATGGTILPEFVVLDLHGVRTVLCHGDILCTADTKYQAYRARMRNPAVYGPLLRLPYVVRRAIAQWMQRRSHSEKALKPEAIMDVTPSAVAEAFRAHGAQRMIHGHTHRPARHEHEVDGTRRERIVLADWHDGGHYLEVDVAGAREREIGA